jgi:hypothetical protein
MQPVDEYQAAQVRDSASNRLAELEERLHAFPARTREIVADCCGPDCRRADIAGLRGVGRHGARFGLEERFPLEPGSAADRTLKQ